MKNICKAAQNKEVKGTQGWIALPMKVKAYVTAGQRISANAEGGCQEGVWETKWTWGSEKGGAMSQKELWH